MLDLDIARCYEMLREKNMAKEIYAKSDLPQAKERLNWIELNTKGMTPIQAQKSNTKRNSK
jgi:hypothetical protein